MSKTLDCGCVIYSAGRFTFCKLHAQAPALLEALEKALPFITGSAAAMLAKERAINAIEAAK